MIAFKSFRHRAGFAALLACALIPVMAMAQVGVSIQLGGPAVVEAPPPEYIAPGYYPPVYGPEYVPDYYDYHHRPRPHPVPHGRPRGGPPHGDPHRR